MRAFSPCGPSSPRLLSGSEAHWEGAALVKLGFQTSERNGFSSICKGNSERKNAWPREGWFSYRVIDRKSKGPSGPNSNS